jgi:hypothetical protein
MVRMPSPSVASPAAATSFLGRGHRRGWGVALHVLLLRVLALALWGWCDPGAAQGVEGDVALPRVHEVAPELFYMEDDAGRLVPVPGFRYRDFADLFRMQQGLAGPLQPPAAVLENVVVRIDARDVAAVGVPNGGRSAVTCPVTVECSIRQPLTGWAAVPLELGGLLLSGPPRHEGPGRMVVDVDQRRGGYRAWFDAPVEPNQEVRHTVVLEARMPVEANVSHESFAVRVPVAVASRIEVRSARRGPTVHVQPRAADETVAPADDAADGSIVSIAGVVGATRIRIADAQEDRDQRGVAAEAVAESTVRIDGRNAVTQAVIRLANLPPDTSRVRIALPPGTTLREVKPPATLVVRDGNRDDAPIDVAVDVGEDGRAVVELGCERAVDPSGAAAFESIGFTVEGIAAWRQWGRVSVVVDGDWRVTWSDPKELRRVDPPANVREQGFIAAFAYDAQPASLPLVVRPRRSRVVIEPEYRYEVGAGRIVLDARLRVAARGAPVSSVAMAIDPAWSIDEVGPAGAVDVAGVTAEAGEIVVPFAQALAGDAVIEVRASLPIQKESASLVWKLPVPRADLVGPAVVVIASQSDIELLPENEGISGLVRQTAAAVPLADADKTALVYRLDAAEGTFAAARRFLPRRVEAAITAQVAIDSSEMVVEETIGLNVLHVPLEFIELTVPDEITSAGTIEVRQDDELLDPTVVAAEVAADADVEKPEDGVAATTCVRAVLPVPLLGSGKVIVRFRIPTPAIPPESTVVADLPLVLPRAAGIGRQTISVAAPDALALGLRGDAWRRDVAPAAGATAPTWSAAKPQLVLPLTLSTRGVDAARSMVVEAAWLQTRLLPGVREDLRTYVISAAEDRIALSLPATDGFESAARAVCEVRLDGDLVSVAPPTGRLVVDLPRSDPTRRWRLDIRTTTPRSGGWAGLAARFGLPGTVRLDPPVFEPPVLERRFYWSIHTRRDEHLLGLPAAWTSQQQWRPSTMGWRLAPAASSEELSGWIADVLAGSPADESARPELGATAIPAVPPLAERTFVFAGIGGPGDASAWLVPNWFVVLIASGVSLAVGMALVYRPVLRRVPLLTGAAAVLGLAAVAAPNVSPLVVQAAVPGAVLALAAWALRILVTPRRGHGDSGPRAPVSASSLTRPHAPRPSLIVTSAVDDAPSTTQARPS